MASAFNRFGAVIVRHSFRTRPQNVLCSSARPAFFHRTVHCRDADEKQSQTINQQKGMPAEEPKSVSDSTQSPPVANNSEVKDSEGEIENYEQVEEGELDPFSPEAAKERAEWEDFMANPPEEHRAAVEEYKRKVSQLEAAAVREFEMGEPREYGAPEPRFKPGLHSMGEIDEEEVGEDEDFEGNDITSLAHGDLEQHREIREYMRLAAWEMPLLRKFVKPFEVPGKDMPLRFRHTSYMGETHPAENKIILEFCTADLPLTPQQRLKLVKLVGPRYDPQKDLVKMSCEMFETAAQNKRYLGDMVDTLITEARSQSDAEGGKDQFDDVAPDFRHVRWKKRFAFPEAWKMTPEKQDALERDRKQRLLADEKRREKGLLVHGPTIIEQALKRQSAINQAAVERARIGARPGMGR